MLALLLALASCIPVEGDRILVRDLASAVPALAGANPDEIVALAPVPGVQRRLNRIKGVPAEIDPICVERPTAPLTKEKITNAIQAALPNDAQFELLDFSAIEIPKGELEFPRSGLLRPRPAAPRDPTIWRGQVKYGVNRAVPVWVRLRVWTPRQAIVAASDLHTGGPIDSAGIKTETIDTFPFSTAASLSQGQVLGMLPRRPIRTGEIISSTALAEPNDVTRGESVSVEARAGAAILKFEARAEASGRIGASIPVRNPGSGRIFQAKILRKGWVVVE